MGGSTGQQRKGRSCQIAMEGGVRLRPPVPRGMRMLGEHLRSHGNRASSDGISGRAQESALDVRVCLRACWGCHPLPRLQLCVTRAGALQGAGGLAPPAEADGSERSGGGTWKAKQDRDEAQVCGTTLRPRDNWTSEKSTFVMCSEGKDR